MKKWLSTASSQVASTSTTIQPWSFCPKQTLASPQCSGSASHARVYTCHVCIHAMSSGDPWFSSQSSHSREGSLATTWAEAQLHRGAFSVVTPCHGLSVAPRGTSEETGHHRDTWGHKRLRFLHSNLSVHQNASFDRRWWFTYPCYSHVRCKKNCPCPVLAWFWEPCVDLSKFQNQPGTPVSHGRAPRVHFSGNSIASGTHFRMQANYDFSREAEIKARKGMIMGRSCSRARRKTERFSRVNASITSTYWAFFICTVHIVKNTF